MEGPRRGAAVTEFSLACLAKDCTAIVGDARERAGRIDCSGFATTHPSAGTHPMHVFLMLAAQGSADSGMLAAIKHNPTFILCNVVVSVVVITIVIERFAFQMSKYRVNSKEFF